VRVSSGTALSLTGAALLAGCSSFNVSPAADGGGKDGPSTVISLPDGETHDVGFHGSSDGDRDAGHAHVIDAESADDAESDGPSGSSCDSSTCGIDTLLSTLTQGGTLAVDDTNVYVEDQGTTTGEVVQCPKTGCASPITLGPGYATGIAVDSTYVYWNDFAGGEVVRCTIGGCANQPTVLVPNQPHAEGLSFDGVNLYWATAGNILTCASPACGSPVLLANGQSTLITSTTAETSIVYWVSGSSVLGCPAAGCNQEPTSITPGVAASPEGNTAVVKDGFVYYTSGNAVISCPVTSKCEFPRTVGSSSAPIGIASDGSDVYWLDANIARVYRCPVTGCVGSAEVFADQTSFDPAGEVGANVALDGEYAYWADPTSVYRKHK
jgi:hypothetical protein